MGEQQIAGPLEGGSGVDSKLNPSNHKKQPKKMQKLCTEEQHVLNPQFLFTYGETMTHIDNDA